MCVAAVWEQSWAIHVNLSGSTTSQVQHTRTYCDVHAWQVADTPARWKAATRHLKTNTPARVRSQRLVPIRDHVSTLLSHLCLLQSCFLWGEKTCLLVVVHWYGKCRSYLYWNARNELHWGLCCNGVVACMACFETRSCFSGFMTSRVTPFVS